MSTKLSRSENMSRIRSRNTRPELLLRRALWAAGLRYRLHYNLVGKPDLVLIKARIAIFVDGCFWHGCPQHYSAPNARQEFWKAKLRENVLRDFAADDGLVSKGWKVLRIWQHELKSVESIVARIRNVILVRNENYEVKDQPLISVAESAGHYCSFLDKKRHKRWYVCDCGSEDVRVLGVSNPGSLRLNALKRPEYGELICRACRRTWTSKIPSV